MSSIIRAGDTFHGISVFGRGVFTDNKYGRTYAGRCKDGYACGLGLLAWSYVRKDYAEYGPDGQYDGRNFGRSADGFAVYRLWERGIEKDGADVSADGRSCRYNGVVCAPDDPRLLALIALVAPVEVRPAAPAPTRHSDPLAIARSAGSLCPRRRSRRPWPPRCTPAPHACPGGRAAQPNDQSHCNARPRSDALTDRCAEVVTREEPSCTLTTAAWCAQRARPGSFVAMP
jgi:hypothetical protein